MDYYHYYHYHYYYDDDYYYYYYHYYYYYYYYYYCYYCYYCYYYFYYYYYYYLLGARPWSGGRLRSPWCGRREPHQPQGAVSPACPGAKGFVGHCSGSAVPRTMESPSPLGEQGLTSRGGCGWVRPRASPMESPSPWGTGTDGHGTCCASA